MIDDLVRLILPAGSELSLEAENKIGAIHDRVSDALNLKRIDPDSGEQI